MNKFERKKSKLMSLQRDVKTIKNQAANIFCSAYEIFLHFFFVCTEKSVSNQTLLETVFSSSQHKEKEK